MWCPANNFHLMPYRLSAQVAHRGATRDGLPGLGPAMTIEVVMPGLDPGIHAERKIDAELKLICGTPH